MDRLKHLKEKFKTKNANTVSYVFIILFFEQKMFPCYSTINVYAYNNSEVNPEPLDDDTERHSWFIESLNYASYTQLVRMVKIRRCRRPEALA